MTQTTLPQLPQSASLYVRVQALGALGAARATETSAFNSEYGYSNVAVALPPLPQAPGALVATTVAADEIALTWSYPEAGAALLTGFNVYRGTSAGGPFALVGSSSATTFSFADRELDAGTPYYYVVTANNDAGEGNDSNTASATTKGIGLAPPTNLSAKQQEDNSVRLTWRDNTSAETGYLVLQKIEGEATYTRLAELPANSSAYTVPYYLVTDARLTYEVRAMNATQESEPATAILDYQTPAQHWLLLPVILRR